MGNSNSGSFNTAHSPPPWTQSLPRDVHRQKKYGAVQQGTKVLPERIPGQRLRPTENGRILHHQGTISHRKLMESYSVPNEVISVPKISQHHSTSMSALNLSPSMAPRTIITDPRRGDVILPQRKTFKSEPDLREMPPFDIQHPQMPNSLHTIIHESPTKGRIMSKKRYKAPPPPQNYNDEMPLQLIQRDKPSAKAKSKKSRIFKKNSTAKVHKNESDDELNRNIDTEERKSRNSTKNNPHVFEEAKERTRSLDNLRYRIQKSKESISYPMHIVSINTPERNLYPDYQENSNLQHSVSNYPSRPARKENITNPYGDTHKANNIVDKPHFNGSKHIDDFPPPALGNKDYNNSKPAQQNDVNFASEITASAGQKVAKNNNIKSKEYGEDAWDKAEREWTERKQNSEILQKEITNVAKNLKKVPSMSRKIVNDEPSHTTSSDGCHIESNKDEAIRTKSEPKTFFFGMNPTNKPDLVVKTANPGIKVEPVTVVRTAINDKVIRCLDKRITCNNNKLACEESPNTEKKRISKKMDEFVANIEQNKPNLRPSHADLLQSISHEDGGYHSRQSSETWQAENDKDACEKIRVNLRPTLPKRQLELPRFSPNAAWRSLGVETSARSKESLSDTLENPGSVQSHDEKTHRSKNFHSSRGSGEKSGDSGISGDGGSPGLVSDFEPIILKKRDTYNGPIAISSPISSSKLENKRAWTPAQDLDDNSFEDSGDHSSKLVPHEIPTFPKLTSRNNMFADIMENDVSNNGDTEKIAIDKSLEKVRDENSLVNINDMPLTAVHSNNTDIPTHLASHDGLVQNNDDVTLNEDIWRENWSLSRSIPNSMNKCDDNDCNSNSSYIHGTRSESRMSNGDGRHVNRPITPSYMNHGNAGHIMYLPQYKTYNLKYKPHIRDCYSVNGNEPSRHFIPEDCSSPVIIDAHSRNARDIALEKKKKFAYKSTIRMLEKRWIEEKLTKDVREKEDRRLKEMDEIMKVEKEFRNKREKEKIKLKKQLHLMNTQQSDSSCPSNTGSVIEDKTDRTAKSQNHRHDGMFPISTPPRNVRPSSSLGCGYNANDQLEDPISFISGMKKWVKGRKKCSNGYASDASSTTITSNSRQEPDGAPAVANRRGENGRDVIIAGSRSRNGSLIIDESPQSSEFQSESKYRARDFSSDMHSNTSVCTSVSSDQKRNSSRHSFVAKLPDHSGKRFMHKSSKSPVTSESSRTSSRRPYSPNLKGAPIPESKRSMGSEPLVPTQELYEESRDSRKYIEYRISPKRPTSQQSIKYYRNVRDNELIDNYRRNFAQGQALNYPQRSHQEEGDTHSRHSSDSKNKRSEANARRNYSVDSAEPVPSRKLPFRQSLSHNYRVPSVNSSPARYAVNHLTPFSQSEDFRPVVFNSNSANKVLSVT